MPKTTENKDSLSKVLNKRITVYKKIETSDHTGKITENIDKVGLFWCSIKPISNRNFLDFEREDFAIYHQITTRYTLKIKINSIIKYEDREITIKQIFQDEMYHKTTTMIGEEILSK